MAAFQRLAHHRDIAGAIKGEIGATSREVRDGLHHLIGADLIRVDEMRHAEFARHGLFGGVDVYADDLIRPHHTRALDDIQPNAAQAEYRDIGAGPDLGGVDHGTNAGGDSAANVANLIKGRVFPHLRHGDFRQHSEIRKSAAPHIVKHGLAQCCAFATEAAGAIGHHALALCAADGGAKIAALAQAGFACAAFRRVERDDMIARLHTGHTCADFTHNARPFMAEDGGEKPLRIQPIQGIGIRVADPCRHDFDQNFPRLGAGQIHRFDGKGFFGFPSHCSARLHSLTLSGF